MTEMDGMPRKRWKLYEPAPEVLRAALPGEHPVLVQVLYNRGRQTAGDILSYLDGGAAEHDPFLLPDMERAAERVARAIRGAEPVGIYGDFDVDGLTGAAVL